MEPDEGAEQARERELVERARSGDVDAYAGLVDLHRQPALRLAYVMVGSEAEDVTQEAFIKAYTKLDSFRPDARFRPWLMTIVANEARNRRRAAGRRHALHLRVAARRDIADATPEDRTVVHEARQSLLDAVAALPDKDREVVALRYLLGLSEAETAEALGCPPGTVKSRLSRALDKLRAVLEQRPADAGEVSA